MNGNDAAEESDEHDSKSAPFYAKDDNVGQRRELRIFHAPKKRDLTSVFRPLSVRWNALWRPKTPFLRHQCVKRHPKCGTCHIL
jgi:hypothetical protein